MCTPSSTPENRPSDDPACGHRRQPAGRTESVPRNEPVRSILRPNSRAPLSNEGTAASPSDGGDDSPCAVTPTLPPTVPGTPERAPPKEPTKEVPTPGSTKEPRRVPKRPRTPSKLPAQGRDGVVCLLSGTNYTITGSVAIEPENQVVRFKRGKPVPILSAHDLEKRN